MQELGSHDESEIEHERNAKNMFCSLIKEFCDYTSAHGLGRIMAATHWVRKVLWIMLLLVAMTIMTIQVNVLYQKYQSRPLTTLVTVETASSLPFPVVTFCNFNALKNDSLQAAKADGMDIFKNLFTSELAKNISSSQRRRRSNDPAPTLESLADQEGSSYDSDDDDDGNLSWDDDEEFQDPFKKDPTFLKNEQLAVLMAKEDLRLLSMIGHQFDDMVLSCTYRGVPCKNFSSVFWNKFWHYKYGNCFVFNSGKMKSGKDAPILKSNKPGPSHGLILELNIEQEEYLGQMSPEAGIKLDISPHGEMPFPLERGLSLAPGYATMIGMRKEVIKREDPFQSKRCLKEVTKDDTNLYTKHFGAVYSSTACRKSCLAYNQLRKCRCMQYQFPGSSKYGICSVIDKSTLKCLSNVQKMFKENNLNCTTSCPPPCREEGYKMSSSFALWPSEKYEPIYEKALQKEYKILFTKRGSSHRKNVCKLQVFYEELNLEVITERRSYEIEDFVSDIGGQLGLWIGFSVLTAAEFLELFMLIFHAVFKNCGAKKTQKSNHIHQDIVA